MPHSPPEGRFRLCQRIEAGWTIAAAAESMNISRRTAHKWWGPISRVGGRGPGGSLEQASDLPHRTEAQWLTDMAERLEERKGKLHAPRLAEKMSLPSGQLAQMAKEQQIPGRSSMNHEELAATVAI
jgi:hypothetical protein